ncbi:TetR/AcrR family transcriptional regulator [Streptomyces cavernicola]|uniref:TetR/AcrR family transcriptional regulator n=1 Tax=Streptomyces cavernicola TaxID=3043613 RepID=A0ABT6SIM8_9ACTN|nr:TetR/AcrR family transcriptional regulator [Streptomyces sp. B-S-A6]MDI3407527.1 TetR/AcrR family transcriptional regulator [Streptomyces sp. B-S-A6]
MPDPTPAPAPEPVARAPRASRTAGTSRAPRASSRTSSRAELIADTAITLLARRGMRGLTHRAVDEAAGLPQGSTSNHARTRLALLEATVRRQAEREAQTLMPAEAPDPEGGVEALADTLALALHRALTEHRELTVSRYELALEATRRPELRAFYDEQGAQFRTAVEAMLRAVGSRDPRRHTLSLVAWSDGLMLSCTAGSYHAEVPSLDELRTGFREMLGGMVGPGGQV